MTDNEEAPAVVDSSPGPRVLELDREAMLSLIVESVAMDATVWVRIRGSSMVPAIPAGSAVRLRRLAASEPSVGDVVLAVTAAGLPLLHRVVRVDARGVQTMGDRLLRLDPPMPASAVIAIAEAVARDGTTIPVPKASRMVKWVLLRRVIRWLATLRHRLRLP